MRCTLPILGAIVALLALLGIGLAAAGGDGDAVVGMIFGVGAIIFLPIFYGVLGFIGGAIMAIVYNVVAGFAGGLELALE